MNNSSVPHFHSKRLFRFFLTLGLRTTFVLAFATWLVAQSQMIEGQVSCFAGMIAVHSEPGGVYVQYLPPPTSCRPDLRIVAYTGTEAPQHFAKALATRHRPVFLSWGIRVWTADPNVASFNRTIVFVSFPALIVSIALAVYILTFRKAKERTMHGHVGNDEQPEPLPITART